MSLFATADKKLTQPDLGLLVLRLVFGLIIGFFGVQKLLGGQANLEMIGGALAKFGITQQPELWGLLAALTETIGGVCILLGLFFRPAALLLTFNMVVASSMMWGKGPDFTSFGGLMGWVQTVAMPVAFCTAFLALLFTGPGKFAIHKSSGGGRGASSGKNKE